MFINILQVWAAIARPVGQSLSCRL